MRHKGKNRHRGKRRFGEGQQNLGIDPVVRGAIDGGLLKYFRRQCAEKLAQQKDKKGAPTKVGGDNQRLKTVEPAEIFEEHKGWNQRHYIRQHERRQQDTEEEFTARKA